MVCTTQGLGLRVGGVVQGVGFRPFVFRLAKRLGLTGYVKNTGNGVFIALYGPKTALKAFIQALNQEAPPLAKIEKIEKTPLNEPAPPIFTVLESEGENKETLIPPDVATCEACLRELFDPEDRRYRYPFTNCTDCGPRFTVIEDLPYDREKTTMCKFPMCPACLAEYTDPANRRFHAEPNACPECGPKIWVVDRRGVRIPHPDPLKFVIEALKEGKIVAIKGLGGFHLACDATDKAAVARLRERKKRPRKPLAVMVADLEKARKIAQLSPREEEILTSSRRPILLARKQRPFPLAENVAPGLEIIGLMLPYTPLHHLLLREGDFLALVMTSGNLSGEPLCWTNDEALSKLSTIADFFLLHDRDIVIGVDDSVLRIAEEELILIRRARGFVPEPLPFPKGKNILAFGPHLKNTFTLTRKKEAFVSQHLGDLEDLSNIRFFESVRLHFERLLGTKPELLACDLHPGYLSTILAEEAAQKGDLPLIKVQHHLAHAVSVAGEWGLKPPFLALVLDGLGLGSDHTLWGGELLLVQRDSFKRIGHLAPVPQPGGDKAAKNPWRMFLAYLWAQGTDDLRETLSYLPGDFVKEAGLVWQMLKKWLNAPLTTSLGRFFDACAAALGLAYENSFEGEAPMLLESKALRGEKFLPLRAEIRGEKSLILDLKPLLKELLLLKDKEDPSTLALSLHEALNQALGEWVFLAAEKWGLKEVVLSGGCFQNFFLAGRLPKILSKRGIKVFLPRKLPPNDGGVSYGQALWAAWQAGRGRA